MEGLFLDSSPIGSARSPEQQYRGAFELVTYPEATHGWNQSSQSFFTEIGCKGRGCINRNVFNKEVTEASTKDVVRFFSDKLGGAQQ